MLMGKIFTFSGTDCTTPGFIVPAGKAFIITEATFFISSSSPPSEGDLLLETGTGGASNPECPPVGFLSQRSGSSVRQKGLGVFTRAPFVSPHAAASWN